VNRLWILLYPLLAVSGAAQTFQPTIPRAWDDHEVTLFELPLAQPDRSPRYVSSDDYYQFKVRPVYRGYPVYFPGKEPPGYLESLRQKEPEVVFDPGRLRTEEDWIRAGELVFDAPTTFLAVTDESEKDSKGYYRAAPFHVTREGILPYFQYVVRKKGTLEFGVSACANCHTRVMPDGTALRGAQGDAPFAQRAAWNARNRGSGPEQERRIRELEKLSFAAPWVTKSDEFDNVSIAEHIRRRMAMQPGVIPRQGSSSTHPPKVPSLIGIKDIRYLDSTGLVRHRSIGDLMRYAIVNYGVDLTAHFGDFQPTRSQALAAEEGTRYSDEQLYALALYLYSLQPPPNPNPFDERARRGQRVFQQQGCASCHVPPLYTNNKLTPALGFQVPEQLRKSDDILGVSVGTDPTLATKTRRGTGFYKVPSLRGVWYRNAFGHNGQADSLEEWFDLARLRDDYVPKGFHLGPGAIQGHEFGLRLPPDERQALIAFLKTL
jgi:hypothetical protein